jgi:hypothetical protein
VTTDPPQHDDHIWFTVHGEGWAIRRIERVGDETVVSLWRGYYPELEFAALRVSCVDWDAYCRDAAALLATLCEDCPPVGYPTDDTRCLPCPRRK